MKIDQAFIDRLKEQRNLQSCVNNAAVLAQCIRELQRAVTELQLKVGIPRGADEQ